MGPIPNAILRTWILALRPYCQVYAAQFAKGDSSMIVAGGSGANEAVIAMLMVWGCRRLKKLMSDPIPNHILETG